MKTILLCLTAIIPILLIIGCDDRAMMITDPGSTNFTISPAVGSGHDGHH